MPSAQEGSLPRQELKMQAHFAEGSLWRQGLPAAAGCAVALQQPCTFTAFWARGAPVACHETLQVHLGNWSRSAWHPPGPGLGLWLRPRQRWKPVKSQARLPGQSPARHHAQLPGTTASSIDDCKCPEGSVFMPSMCCYICNTHLCKKGTLFPRRK